MRRAIVLALLFVGMAALQPLGTPGHGGQWLLTFGFLILAAHSAGELLAGARLPKILGYLLAGALFGPSGLGAVNIEAVHELSPVSSLAIALIAYLAGAELRWKEVRDRGAIIGKILTAELLMTFVAVTVLLLALRPWVPFLREQSFPVSLVFAMLFGSIAIVHSPAVTMALLTETKAGGPVARTTLGLVLTSDIAVILLFSGVLALAQYVAPPTGVEAAGVSLRLIMWEILGAILVGAVLGAAVALYLRFVKRELFLFSVVVAFFGSIIARLAHVETLLMLLTAGFVTENLSRYQDGEDIRHAMERSAAPIFVVFFALAGAELALQELASVWPLVVPIVLVRVLAIRTGTKLGARWAHATHYGDKVWLGLVSQAGVAIGLATAVAQAYPSRGAQIRTLFLGVVAINEMLGPVLFRHALVSSGEVRNSAPEERAAGQSAARTAH